MIAVRRTLDSASVDLPGGRQFTATMLRHGDGEPADLILSVGYADDGHGWRTQAGTLALPPSALAEIRAALESLERINR